MNILSKTNAHLPYAYVTMKRQRVKQYNDIVYLNNDDEFEIELFNPTSNKILAEIRLNDNNIGPNVILRPGERVFLERFTDITGRKFIFKTYSVNGSDTEVQKAIANNGDIEVKFFEEKLYQPQYYYYNTYTTTSTYFNYDEDIVKPFIVTCSTQNQTRNLSETGRIEKGSVSNQEFGVDYLSEFDMFPFCTTHWKLLPKSNITNTDIVVYCKKCGKRKRKNAENYCSNCGTKF